MYNDDSVEGMFQTAAHIKQYQLNQDKKEFDKLPEFYKNSIYQWQMLNNVHNQSFYVKKCAFNALKSLAVKELNQGLLEDASFTFSKSIAIFKYIKTSNLKFKTEGGIKDSELTYVNDEGKDEDEKKEITKMKISSLLNISLCEFALKHWVEVRSACDEVLKLDPFNIKALYRKARSYLDNPASLMDDYLAAKKLLDLANSLDPSNADVKKSLDDLNAYIAKEKNDEKKIFKSFYRNVNYKMNQKIDSSSEELLKAKNKEEGKPQLRMLDLIIEMCYTQLEVYERRGDDEEKEKMANVINRAKNYRTDLQRLINIDFEHPSEEILSFCKEQNLDIKDKEVREHFDKLKKDYIEEINKFHQDNLLLMKKTNDDNMTKLEQLKKKKKDTKMMNKLKKEIKKYEAQKDVIEKEKSKLKGEEKQSFNKKVFFITFFTLMTAVLLRHLIKTYYLDD